MPKTKPRAEGGQYRMVQARIWNDADFRRLSILEKLVTFHVLTHPDLMSFGAIRANIPGLAADLGVDCKAYRMACDMAFGKGSVMVDDKASLVVIVNYIRHNRPGSINVIKSWKSLLNSMPESDLLSIHMEAVRADVEAMGHAYRDAMRHAMPHGMSHPPNSDLQALYREKQSKKRKSGPGAGGVPYTPRNQMEQDIARELGRAVSE